jgi:hypothetical protein
MNFLKLGRNANKVVGGIVILWVGFISYSITGEISNKKLLKFYSESSQ